MVNEDYELISRSLRDEIIESQRAKLIPNYCKVKNVAIENILCDLIEVQPVVLKISVQE